MKVFRYYFKNNNSNTAKLFKFILLSICFDFDSLFLGGIVQMDLVHL